MRVPVSWLREWVDLPSGLELPAMLEHLHAALVKVGFEEEDIHVFDVTGPVVVGRVLEREPEPQSNGKTINWCRVDVGEAEPRGIVCGAHNFEAGDLVVVTLPGAVLPGGFAIAARKTYGHVSDGMIASARELGYGDEHDGILRLADLGIEAPVGADAIALLGLDDGAVDINVTPDRGYALSIRGLAREYGHSTGARFSDPAEAVTVEPSHGFDLSVVDDAPIRGNHGAPTGVFRVVRGIDGHRPTPPWMRARLLLAGIRSISLPVDVTNYVMLELGQPIHGYDLAKVRGGIAIRRARPGESIETLDGKRRELDVEDLVVCDDSGPIGLGAVMGGASTEMGADTVDVLVEAFHWDPISVSRSARRHKLFSEASKRFERGVDPAMPPIAAQRVVDLLVELAGGTADELGASFGAPPAPAAIALDVRRPEALIGVAYTDEEVVGTLELIGAEVARDGDALAVTPPSWRPDLVDDAGLVEEIARITGYDRVGSALPTAPPGRGLTPAQRLRRRVGEVLAAAGGTEVLSYPFQSEETVARFSPEGEAFHVANALDPREPYLRRSLLPGLAVAAQRNLSRGLTDLALFELGRVFGEGETAGWGTEELPPLGVTLPDATVAGLLASVPPQPWHVGALLLGDAVAAGPGRAAEPAGLADALDVVRQVALAAGVAVEVRAGSHPALHPGRTAEIVVRDASGAEHAVGVAGELMPALAEELDLPRVVAVAELDLDAVMGLAGGERVIRPIGALPAATQDLSLVVPAEVPAAEVLAAVVEGAGELLEHAALVDDYRGAGLPEGRKSLTFALRFRAEDRTLTAAEATEAKLAGAARAGERVGATIRE
ncbi:MAG: phenylalanine--tRNA ligase subunit beta [Actinomycetales bacterium]|nr:phenylalanine--tRNA ligase subunit beta [Actinomycetales bacterium]